MNYAGIILHDSANGPGWRVTLFVSGCQHHCLGCQNIEAQDYNYGDSFTLSTKQDILQALNRPEIKGLSISGGDPLWQEEQSINELTNICKSTHELGKDVWLWTGFTWEEIFNPSLDKTTIESCRNLLLNCDVVIDGRFIEKEKDLSLPWRGSRNQRIINVKETIAKGYVVVED